MRYSPAVNCSFLSVCYAFFMIGMIPSTHAETEGMIFLIQNKWGGIHGISLNAELKPSSPAMVRPDVVNLQNPLIIDLNAFSDGGYQLTNGGKILPIGNARLPYAAWTPVRNAVALAMTHGEEGGWIAVDNTVKKIGNPLQLVLPTLDTNESISDIEYDPHQQRLAVLTRKGKIVLCNLQESKTVGTISLKKDRAIRIAFAPDGFWILTESGKVYLWNEGKASQNKDVPALGSGNACDLETPRTGKGFYILDIFGVIHACAGAPAVPTEPLTQPAAVDLEIIPGTTLPRWDPPGLHTKIGWETDSLNLDPEGPSKSISLIVDQAEHMTVFLAQVYFDPAILTVDPSAVRVGAWWDKGLRVARINPVVDQKNGILKLQGSGDYFPYEGATGGGELAHFAIAPIKGVTEAVSVLEIREFFFRDAYQSDVDHACAIINSCTVHIAPIQPRLNFAWKKGAEWIGSELKPVKSGEIVQADILIENGSRIGFFEFGFQFTNSFLRFLGMTPGTVWRPDAEVKTRFDIPSRANQPGKLEKQTLEVTVPGACDDQKKSIVSLFFAVTAPGKGQIQLEGVQSRNIEGTIIDIKTEGNTVSFTGE